MARRLKAAALVAFFCCASSLSAQWRVGSSQPQGTAAGGVTHLAVEAENAESGARASLHLAVFSTRNATLRMIDDPEADESLGAVMPREKCVAGVNGGYFDPEYAPVGLLVSDGRTIAPLRKARLLSGVVSVVNGRVQIQRTAEYSPKAQPSAARQCGPFLVDRGKPIAGLNDVRRARRTFVATLGGERAAVGYCSHVTLAQLGAILSAAADVKIQRALNLDGGSSSGFWFAGENGPFTIRELKTVRDYIGVTPR